MIGLIAKAIISKSPATTLNHARKIAKVGTALACVLLLVVGFSIWNYFDNNSAIAEANAKRIIKETEVALEADRAATENDYNRRSEAEKSSEQTLKEMKNAEDQNPEEASAPAGPVSRAAADRLR